MDDPPVPADAGMQEHHIVKADEVDQTGTDISPVSDDQLMEEVAEGLRQEQDPDTGAVQPNAAAPPLGEKVSRRPELRRDAPAPPPPLQPPPPAPVPQGQEAASTSLSLDELKQLLRDMPKSEQSAYAFKYADAQPFPEEVEEWFQYSEFDQVMLLGMKSSWDHTWDQWRKQCPSLSTDSTWLDAPHDLRKSFMGQVLLELGDPSFSVRVEALEVICYAVTGIWGLTAGLAVDDYPEEPTSEFTSETPKLKSMQIEWIENSVRLIQDCSGVEPLLDYLVRVFDKNRDAPSFANGTHSESTIHEYTAEAEREANLILTALYFVVEVGRRQYSDDFQQTELRDALTLTKTNLLVFLVEVIARLRWDDSADVPLTRIVLLLWKTLLFCFGGTESLQKAKEELEPFQEEKQQSPSRRTPFLTASPLDYHMFRQEITSKYPAYNPPPPVVPLELDNSSILPPLPQHPSRSASSNGLFSGVGPPVPGGNGSILHQSVHIATPAPSPPPSPMGPGGKGGKKQNYQTNQNFPFMYPPLDNSSNEIGGKGTSELQDLLVGRKWEGSDVPASIIEAGKLFSSHVKMTRAIRQLWEEREHFMKYDRGWNDDFPNDSSEQAGAETQEKEKETDNEDTQRRLDAVEDFYVSLTLY